MAFNHLLPGTSIVLLNNEGKRALNISYVNDADATVIRVDPEGQLVTGPGPFPLATTFQSYFLYPSGKIKTFEAQSADGSHIVLNFADSNTPSAPDISLAYGPTSGGAGLYEHGPLVSSTFSSASGYTINQEFVQQHLTSYSLTKGSFSLAATHDVAANTYSVTLQKAGPSSPLVATGGGNIDPFVKVISNDGSSIISQDGAGLISGGNLTLSHNGASLISQDGAGLKMLNIAMLISQDGAGVISNDGSSLISQDGAGIMLGEHVVNTLGLTVNTAGSNPVGNEALQFAANTNALFGRGLSLYTGPDTFTSGPDDDHTDFRIAVGATRADRIDFLGDVDLWTITNTAGNAERQLIAGETYLIDLKGTSSDDGTLVDPFLRVYAADKATVVAEADDGGAGFNSQLLFTPITTGFYYIEAGARDDGSSGSYTLTVQDPSPVITSNGGGDTAGVLIPENTDIVTTVTADDPDSGTTLQYSITGGADAALFGINAGNGTLFFLTPPDFELPDDAGENNSYVVEVQASDGVFFDRQTITVNVTDVNEGSAVPEIAVWGNHTDITSGDATPSADDHTAFGQARVGDVVERSFAVINQGSAPLQISKITVPKGAFSIVEPLNGTIAPGGFDFFTVQMDTGRVGTKAGNIVVKSNDSSERTFSFAIDGSVVASTANPEIAVSGNSIGITDGDTTPSAADNTDFGTVGVGDNAATHTFTVSNTGDAPLLIGKFGKMNGFEVIEGLNASIAPGTSDTFTVRMDTTKVGLKTGSVSFTTNDADETPFNFVLSGQVVIVPPEIEVRGNGNLIVDNPPLPGTQLPPQASNGTDFGDVAVGSTAIHTFTVDNTGFGTLTISKLKLPKGFALVEGLSSSIAPGGFDTFQVRVDTKKIGLKTGTLTFATNDPDETPFNFNLSANVTAVPLSALVDDDGARAEADALVFDLTAEASGSPLDDVPLLHDFGPRWLHDFDLV
ncbi:choice-of-anchor D domain-containing protein [Pseudorhodoplanes sp.]|uniref:choice-of-anchor D domain-containing protein n=1 Tax=Pseudorhodoplanes sp. TaxID=1934341 RepID=UPI003D0DF96B